MEPLKAIFYRDWNVDHVNDILREIFIDKLYAKLVIDKKDLTIIDIGANIGLFTLWMYPYAKEIYAYEPSKQHFETFTKLIEFNKLDKVKAFQLALSDKDGEATFYHSPNTTAFSLQNVSNDTKDSETVKTVSIATLLKDIPHVDILKVDVEGAEGTAFGNEEFDKVAFKIDNIIMEYHQWCGISVTLLMNTIRDRGFSVEILPTNATVLWFKRI